MQNPSTKSDFKYRSIGALAKYKLPYDGNISFAISFMTSVTFFTHNMC
jgi:hypothetical protein